MQKVILSNRAFLMLRAFVDRKDTEISGLGKVTQDKEKGIFYVHDIYLLPQVATGATTTMSKAGVDKFYRDLMDAGEDTGQYRLWWHSHVNMDVFWSGTDLATINDFDLERPNDNWHLSVVANKKGKLKFRLDVFDPVRITLDDLPWDIDFDIPEITEQVDEDITKNFNDAVNNAESGIIIDDLYSINRYNYWLRNPHLLPKRQLIVSDKT